MRENSDTDPEIIEASLKDPRNVVLNVEKASSLGIGTSGAGPVLNAGGASVGANGWVSFTNEAALVPQQYSDDPIYDSPYKQQPIDGEDQLVV